MTTSAIQARDIRPGMVLPTVGGCSAVRNITSTKDRRGNERRTIIFANGIVATNVRPYDRFETGGAR